MEVEVMHLDDNEYENKFPLHSLMKQCLQNQDSSLFISKIDELMSDKNFDLNVIDVHGQTVLHYAAMGVSVDIIKKLLISQDKIDVNIMNSISMTPLHTAVENENLELVEILLTSGANPNIPIHDEGSTPLHIAAAKGFTNIMEILLRHGAKHTMNNANNTPLHLACSNKRFGAICLLLDSNLDNFNSHNKRDFTPLQVLMKIIEPDYAEFHLQAGNIPRDQYKALLKGATRQNHLDVVRTILSFNTKMDVNAKLLTMHDLGLALYNAAGDGLLEMVKLFLDFGTEVDYKIRTNTSLNLASQRGKIEVMELLIERGAEVNLQGRHEKTALHQAARNQNFPIVKLLLESGANPNIKDMKQETPLHEAALFLQISQILVEYDADVYAENCSGETPFIIAEDLQRYDVFYLFTWHMIMKDVLERYLGRPETPGEGTEVYNRFEEKSKIRFIKKKCLEEIPNIDEMACEEFSYRDILSENVFKLQHHQDNNKLYDYIFSEDFINMFPVYHKMVRCKYRKTLQLVALLKPIGNTFVRLYDLLIQSEEKIVKLLGNPEVIECMESYDLKQISRRYALEISQKYNSAKIRRKLQEEILQGIANTSNAFRDGGLQNFYIEKILFFLDIDSLEKFKKILFFEHSNSTSDASSDEEIRIIETTPDVNNTDDQTSTQKNVHPLEEVVTPEDVPNKKRATSECAQGTM